MTPQARRAFELEWPKLDARLRRVLGRKGVPREEWDDLVQETGARLYSMWERVDPDRPTLPLAVTIMTNLLCDRARRSVLREVSGEVPERESLQDVERESFLRLDLANVHRALAALSVAQRRALLDEMLGIEAIASRRDADKMLRMRARRKLTAMVERVSALAPLRLLRMGDSVRDAVAVREALHAFACVACLVGASAAVAPGWSSAVVAPTGNGGVTRAVPQLSFDATDLGRTEARTSTWSAGDAVAAAEAERERRRSGAAANTAPHGDDTSATPSLIPSTPGGLPNPDGDLPTSPDEDVHLDGPTLPSGGGGGGDGDAPLTPDAVVEEAVAVVEEVATTPGA